MHIPRTPSRWTRLNHSTASSPDSWNRTGSELISSLVLEHLLLCHCNTHKDISTDFTKKSETSSPLKSTFYKYSGRHKDIQVAGLLRFPSWKGYTSNSKSQYFKWQDYYPLLAIWRWEGSCTKGEQLMQILTMRHMKAERANQVKITHFSTDLFNGLWQVIFPFCCLRGFPLLNVTTITVV